MSETDFGETADAELLREADVSEEKREAPIKSALVYAIAATLPRAVGFLLLPAYTRALDPAQYGTVSLLAAASSAAGIVLVLGFDYSVFRTYFELEGDPELQERFIYSAWRFLLVFSLTTATLSGGLFWLAGGTLQRASGFLVFIALLGSALGTSATAIPMAVLRAEQRLRPYAVVSLIATLANAGFTVLAVVILNGGVRGWLVAGLVANTCTFLATCFVLPWKSHVPFDRASVRRSLNLGLPLVPHFFAHWALVLADRVLLAALIAAPALGVYSFASNLALPVMILVQSLNQALMPAYARAGTRETPGADLTRTVLLQATVVAVLCAAGALIAPPLGSILAPSSYGGAESLVTWFILGYGFLGLYYIPMNGTALGAGKTKFVAIATTISAATNLSLIAGFVPRHGLEAAAAASAVGYAVLLLTVFVYARDPQNPVRYPWRALATLFAGVALVYVAARVTTPGSGLTGLLLRSAWVLAGFTVLGAAVPDIRTRLLVAIRLR